MQLETALIYLVTLRDLAHRDELPHQEDAIQLGIEGLERIKADRELEMSRNMAPLPSETKA